MSSKWRIADLTRTSHDFSLVPATDIRGFRGPRNRVAPLALLSGHFESLRNHPAQRHFNVDDHRAVFDFSVLSRADFCRRAYAQGLRL
jgi:hypothetical protein